MAAPKTDTQCLNKALKQGLDTLTDGQLKKAMSGALTKLGKADAEAQINKETMTNTAVQAGGAALGMITAFGAGVAAGRAKSTKVGPVDVRAVGLLGEAAGLALTLTGNPIAGSLAQQAASGVTHSWLSDMGKDLGMTWREKALARKGKTESKTDVVATAPTPEAPAAPQVQGIEDLQIRAILDEPVIPAANGARFLDVQLVKAA
jgi:hypothetical protein